MRAIWWSVSAMMMMETYMCINAALVNVDDAIIALIDERNR